MRICSGMRQCGFEERRVADEDADASRPRGGDVYAVAAEEELHAVGTKKNPEPVKGLGAGDDLA